MDKMKAEYRKCNVNDVRMGINIVTEMTRDILLENLLESDEKTLKKNEANIHGLCEFLDVVSGNGKLTPDDIRNLKVDLLRDILFEDIKNQDYSRLQKLSEAGNISDEHLAKMVDRPRDIHDRLSEMVYKDMADMLSEKILSNKNLNRKFVELYKGKYFRGYIQAQKIIKKECSSNQIYELYENDSIFCEYILLNTNCVFDEKYFNADIVRDMKIHANCIPNVFISDYEYTMKQYQKFTFSDTKESILLSGQFEQFLLERRAEIADLIGVEEEEISEAIADELRFPLDGNNNDSLFAAVKKAGEHVIMSNNGGVLWVREMMGKGIDLDKIIKLYYTSQFISMYHACIDEKGEFTTNDLLNRRISNPEKDFRDICYMCGMDAFYKMFQSMMKSYYKAFFREKIIYGNIKNQHKQEIDERDSIIESQEKQISELKKKLSLALSKEKGRSKDKEKERRENEKELKRLSKEREKQAEEIEHLKECIQSQKEFIEMQDQQEPDEAPDVDIKHLQRGKYLFVGKADELIRKLRRCFLNSIFMQSENKNISDISVNAIIFLTHGMSHSMYYKVKNSSIYKKVPSVMCCTRNIDRIYYDMSSQLKLD